MSSPLASRRAYVASMAVALSRPLACLVFTYGDRRAHAHLQSVNQAWNEAGRERASWPFCEYIFNLLYGMHAMSACDWKLAERILRQRKQDLADNKNADYAADSATQPLIADQARETDALLGLVLMERVDWTMENGVVLFDQGLGLLESASSASGASKRPSSSSSSTPRVERLCATWKTYALARTGNAIHLGHLGRDCVASLDPYLSQEARVSTATACRDLVQNIDVDIECAQERYWFVRICELARQWRSAEYSVLQGLLQAASSRLRSPQQQQRQPRSWSGLGHLGLANLLDLPDRFPDIESTWTTYPPTCRRVVEIAWSGHVERKIRLYRPVCYRPVCRAMLRTMLDHDFSAGLNLFDPRCFRHSKHRETIMKNEASDKSWQHSIETALWAGSRAGNIWCMRALLDRLEKQRAQDKAVLLAARLEEVEALMQTLTQRLS